MIELIGTNAGLVWGVLSEGSKIGFKAVKKAMEIKAEKDIYAAFGRLAKGDKLAFEEIEGKMYVSLIQTRGTFTRIKEGCSILLDGLLICPYVFCQNNQVYSWLTQFKNLLLCRIWYEMTEDRKRLLAVFEVRARDLTTLYDQQKRRIDGLTATLSLKDEELRQAKDVIEGLNAKCNNMLTARIVSTNEEETKSARIRLSKLAQEVDKCIALLDE